MEVLNSAMNIARERHPLTPIQHQAAFANSVAYLVTGASGGYGGPSAREHSVTRAAIARGKIAGEWTIEDAAELADPLCFGPIQPIHRDCYQQEYCFDDAPGDIAELKK